jgi:hypothetical protein
MVEFILSVLEENVLGVDEKKNENIMFLQRYRKYHIKKHG